MSEIHVPQPTPETQPYWDACAEGRLVLQYCTDCRMYIFYPRPMCPHCSTLELIWREVSGKGHLHTYVIDSYSAGRSGAEPTIIAIVELLEGPRMMTNIVSEVDPEDLEVGAPVRVSFTRRDEWTLPLFVVDKE